jgi:excinuclease ABC subunit C
VELKDKVKKLPSCPGVYLMKDSLDSVIYVGKSKNLRNRVGSYFQNSKSHSPKVAKLVKNLRDFDYLITDTEFEAFLLESRLIKEINPIYNRLLKNPKSYTYIKIGTDNKCPSIEITNECVKGDGYQYFGPYTNKNTVERGLQGIKESCRILCTNASRKASHCLNYSLGLCIGMCSEDESRELYPSILKKIVEMLRGSDRSIILEIERNMNTASEKLDFENAAKYRDYLSAVNYLVRKTKVVEYTEENKNIIVLEYLCDGYIKYFLIKGNKLLFSEKHLLGSSTRQDLKSTIKNRLLTYFGNKVLDSPIEVGRDEIDESQIIYSYLNSKSNSCRHVILKNEWLNTEENKALDNALNKLLNIQNR